MLSIVIQAGGKSSRMGENKALIEFRGEKLVERMIRRVSHLSDDLLVVTNQPEVFLFLNVRVEVDLIPGIGALGGVYTALEKAKNQYVAILACDMPFVNPDLLKAEYELAQKRVLDVLVPRTEKGLEPLHSIYRKEACLNAVRSSIEQKQFRVISWFASVNTFEFGVELIKIYDPELLSFFNINTPQDRALAEEIANKLND